MEDNTQIDGQKIGKLGLVLRGMGMGVAEVIPGVSGGTIAFITGIYHNLLNSIKSVDLEFFRLASKLQFKRALERINISFLFFVIVGMVAGLLGGIFFITHLLETQPEILWAAFLALILISVPVMMKSIKALKVLHFICFLVAAFLAYWITGLTPVSPSESLVYIFFGGLVAIVALVLPGISGSFILLLLGLYTYIIPLIKDFLSHPDMASFQVLVVFGLGCVTGLLTFSRLIAMAFQKFRDITIATMSGFMLGSLNKIWPWRNPETLINKESGELIGFSDKSMLTSDIYKLISESNVMPQDYYQDPKVMPVIVVFALTSVLVLAFAKYSPKI